VGQIYSDDFDQRWVRIQPTLTRRCRPRARENGVRALPTLPAAKMFMDHPHFGIPQATIEVMALKAMEG